MSPRYASRAVRCLVSFAIAAASLAIGEQAEADCALIPAAVKRLPSEDGQVDRPFAAPGDTVTIFSDSACKPSASEPHFDPDPANNEITLILDPPTGAIAPAVPSFVAARVLDCGTDRCFALEFQMPDTTGLAGAFPLTGPARLEVRNRAVVGDPVVAVIDELFEPARGCNSQNRVRNLFRQFTVLPPRNLYDPNVSDTIEAALDGSGALVIPLDYSNVLASQIGSGSGTVRLLTITADLANGLSGGNGLPGADGAFIRLPRFGRFVRAFSLNGRPIPPLLEIAASQPLSSGGVDYGDTIVGSVDFVDSVLRIAKVGDDPSSPGSQLQIFALDGEQPGAPTGLTMQNGLGPVLLTGVNLAAGPAAPLNSVLGSSDLAIVARDEQLEEQFGNGEQNGDGDTDDKVIYFRDLTTNTEFNTDMAVVETARSPRKAVVATAGSTVAFLQSEMYQGRTDINFDGDFQDAMLRIFNADGSHPLCGGSPCEITQGSIHVNPQALLRAGASRSPLVVSGRADPGRFVFFGVNEVGDSPVINERVSVAEDGSETDGPSFDGVVSENGQSVAFVSQASNILTGGPSGQQIYVRDMLTLTTRLVSSSLVGGSTGGNGDSENPNVASDGSIVGFDSLASDLVVGDVEGHRDVFVSINPQTLVGQTVALDYNFGNDSGFLVATIGAGSEFVLEGVPGTPGFSTATIDISASAISISHNRNTTLGPSLPAVSDDYLNFTFSGQVAGASLVNDPMPSWFASLNADPLTFGVSLTQTQATAGVNTGTKVWALDLGRDVRRVSSPDGLTGGNGDSRMIRGNGTTAVFESRATNFSAPDTNDAWDIFAVSFTLLPYRVSVPNAGGEANGPSRNASIDQASQFVAFESEATNLLDTVDGNGVSDIFVRDLVNGTTERISVGYAGAEANGGSYQPVISRDGRFVAYASDADNLVAPGTNLFGVRQCYVYDRVRKSTELVSATLGGEGGDGDCAHPAFDISARFVTYSAASTNVDPLQTTPVQQIYFFDRLTGQTLVGSGNTATNTPGAGPAGPFSSIGAVVRGNLIYTTASGDIGISDSNGVDDVYTNTIGLGTSLNPSGPLPDSDTQDTVLHIHDAVTGIITNTLLPIGSVDGLGQVAVAAGRAAVATSQGNGVPGPGYIWDPETVSILIMGGGTVFPLLVAISETSYCAIDAFTSSLVVGDVTTASASFTGIPVPLAASTQLEISGDTCATIDNAGSLWLATRTGNTVASSSVSHAADFQMGQDGVAFRTCEASVGTDLNGDTDLSDCVMRYRDYSDPTIVETGHVAIPCTFPGCDPFFEPYRTGPGIVSFVTSEPDEGGLGRIGGRGLALSAYLARRRLRQDRRRGRRRRGRGDLQRLEWAGAGLPGKHGEPAAGASFPDRSRGLEEQRDDRAAAGRPAG